MPRRIYDYAPDRGWTFWNQFETVGTYLLGVSLFIFLWNVIVTMRKSERDAGDNPWEANTLEWSTSSPPPAHNFDGLPYVTSERPLWDLRHGVAEGAHGSADD
jgi:heme/copper-type cytochrome/quinol oxidase subunit 1